MMLIATTAAFALVASTLLAASPAATAPAMPAITVNVSIDGAGVSAELLARVLAETDAIWRPSGVRFVWRRVSRVAAASSSGDGPYLPNSLHLIIGEARGTAAGSRMPLGWIVFDAVDVPQQEIYLSHANALALMAEARGVVGIIAEMPLTQRQTLLARAMGRALAHELGHYLLASKLHTERGLMKAILTATELFMPDATAFRIDPAQRRAVEARLSGQPLVASR